MIGVGRIDTSEKGQTGKGTESGCLRLRQYLTIVRRMTGGSTTVG